MSDKKPPQHNFFGNLAFNIVIPVVILTNLNSEDRLGPMWSIVLALAFPIAYGIWDLVQSGKVNKISVLGIVSVFLTGGMSLLQIDPQYIAIKEAAIPAIIGIAIVASQYTQYPLIRTMLFNEQVMAIGKLNDALATRQNENKLGTLLNRVSYIVASSFFLSSVLNYVLAKVILVSQPGTPEFTEELGRMTALSYPVIAIPSMIVFMAAFFYLIAQLKKLTGMELEDMLAEHTKATGK